MYIMVPDYREQDTTFKRSLQKQVTERLYCQLYRAIGYVRLHDLPLQSGRKLEICGNVLIQSETFLRLHQGRSGSVYIKSETFIRND